jgi:hypothetical protein
MKTTIIITLILVIALAFISGCTEKPEISCTDQYVVCSSKCPQEIFTPPPTYTPQSGPVDWRVEPTPLPTPPLRPINPCYIKCSDEAKQCYSKY